MLVHAGLRNPDPEKLRAARAWAKAYNSFDVTDLEPLLDEDLRYTSMWVFQDLVGRENYLDYLRAKLDAIRNSGAHVTAEVAETRPYPMYQMDEEPCVYARQESGETIHEAVVLFSTSDGRITKIVMGFVPIPSTVFRTGEVPR